MAEQPRRVLVVGASGQIGGHCLRAFREHDYLVTGTYSTRTSANLVHVDLLREQSIGALLSDHRPSVCILSAALGHVDRCEVEPQLAWAINAEAPRILAEYCRDARCKLVLLSTEYVFDGKAGPYDEDDPPAPLSVYGTTKLAAERYVLQSAPANLVVRTTVVYSFDPHGKNFLMQVLGQARGGHKMRVPNDQISSPTYAPDLATAILGLVELDATGIINVAGPDVVSRYEFAVRAVHALGLPDSLLEPMPTTALGQAAQRPLRAGLRIERVRSLLGSRVRGVEQGVRAFAQAVEAASF